MYRKDTVLEPVHQYEPLIRIAAGTNERTAVKEEIHQYLLISQIREFIRKQPSEKRSVSE